MNFTVISVPDTEYGYVYLDCDKKLSKWDKDEWITLKKQVTDDNKFELFLKEYLDCNVYTYGAKQLHADRETGKGYVWSSRPGVINKAFGTKLVSVCIDNCIYAMELDFIKPLVEQFLGHPITVEKYEDDSDIRYYFTNI